MPRSGRVNLLKKIKHAENWQFAPALFGTKGRMRRDHVRVSVRDEARPEGIYFLEWWNGGQRSRDAVGRGAFLAAERAKQK